MVRRRSRGWLASRDTSRVFDLHLSEEDQEKITQARDRYAKDYRAFAAERLMVIDRDSPDGASYIPFKFNAAQEYLHGLIEKIGDFQWEMAEFHKVRDPSIHMSRLPVHLVCLKARKVGWSTYIQGRTFWKCEHRKGMNCLAMAHEAAASENIMKISKRFDAEYVPTDLPIRRRIDRSSDKLLEWGPQPEEQADGREINWDSRIIVKTAGTKVSGTNRSYTWHQIHISEEAHFVDSDEVAAAFSAKAKYFEAFEESTAKGVGGLFYNNWKNAMWLEDAVALWRANKPFPTWWNKKFRAFWSWLDDPAYQLPVTDWEKKHILETLSPAESDLRTQHKVSIEQLKWRREKIAGECCDQKEMDPELYFNQEYPTTPEEAFVSKGVNVFSPVALARMEKRARDRKPVRTCNVRVNSKADSAEDVTLVDVSVNPQLVIWQLPRHEASYIIGGDTAEGLQHGDDTAAIIFDRTDGTRLIEVARLKSKHNPDEFAYVLAFLQQMYNAAFLVPEANPPGNATCRKLVDLGCYNLYHRENPEMITDSAVPEAFTAGFKTLSNTKPLLVRAAQEALRNEQIELCSQEAIEQWQHYQNEDGEFGAPEGEKDDLVMSDMLACWAHFEHKAPPVRNKVKEKEELEKELNVFGQEHLKEMIEKMIKRARKKNRLEAKRKRSRPDLPI